ncbi:superoxide dismutase [Candidatus Saccharibacteria bacterium]|nr:superoxide dismutase [Candidatus Saccharibacteria bacterium]PJE66341.1 MAG: superoxide dismutase [Candidatus Saccharibacteria bacterium CG10_big_fil_rev_8_21_14_0_10_41_32]
MFKLPVLPYEYESLGKHMSAETLKYHHDKHHQAYVDKLNIALESAPELQGMPLDYLLSTGVVLPDAAKKAIINNGGGHYNHSLFWLCISPNGGGQPSGKIADMIIEKYGSYQKFVEEFSSKALGVFGSGWVWLLPNGDIITTSNQDTPITMGLSAPILCLDVWEHAYYIDYKNKRDDFVKSWWDIVDWESVSSRLDTPFSI